MSRFKDSLDGNAVNVWSCVKRFFVFLEPSGRRVVWTTMPRGQIIAAGSLGTSLMGIMIAYPLSISCWRLEAMTSGLSLAAL